MAVSAKSKDGMYNSGNQDAGPGGIGLTVHILPWAGATPCPLLVDINRMALHRRVVVLGNQREVQFECVGRLDEL